MRFYAKAWQRVVFCREGIVLECFEVGRFTCQGRSSVCVRPNLIFCDETQKSDVFCDYSSTEQFMKLVVTAFILSTGYAVKLVPPERVELSLSD